MGKAKRPYSCTDILTKKYNTIDFDGAWRDLCGTPELSGCWIIYGESGNGKTSFAMQLAKYLTQYEKVYYNSIEEGLSLSIKRAIKQVKMQEVKSRFWLLDKEDVATVEQRLRKKQSPNVIFFDSIQYMGCNKDQIKALIDRHPNKLFIFISHAKKGEPRGSTAEAVKYHANIKIQVVGYRAFAVSRYSEGSATIPYTVWEKGAAEFSQQKSKLKYNNDTETSRESMED